MIKVRRIFDNNGKASTPLAMMLVVREEKWKKLGVW